MLVASMDDGIRTANQPLYDAQRQLYYVKPTLRGWQHLLWFTASLVAGTLLLKHTHGATPIAAVAIYAVSVAGLFGTSALYHRGNWSSIWNRRLQRADHVMIFFLIAGTATPAFLISRPGISAPGADGLSGLIIVWALALVAAGIHLVWMQAPEMLVGATFVGLGVVACLSLPAIWIHTGVAAALLMLAGGLLYSAGAVSYHLRRPDPLPTVFGYHEVFHAYVCAAATVQYLAIAFFIAT
jgi:hemolysin III